jgi:hypothetical protein
VVAVVRAVAVRAAAVVAVPVVEERGAETGSTRRLLNHETGEGRACGRLSRFVFLCLPRGSAGG